MKLLPQGEWGGTAVGEQFASVQKILEGTLRAIQTVGARRLSMRDISDASGVSRGTLYRYFASKEEVLAAVSEYVCASFEQGISEVADAHEEPMERFRAVMKFFAHFTIDRTPDRIFEVEPAFHLDFLRAHFQRHKVAVREALEPSLDYLESRTQTPINREVFIETLVRLQLSTLVIPADENWMQCWNESPEHLLQWALHTVGYQAGTKERMN
ncbi:TetR/AcrR family transcriptional regulator [Novosphingobium sp. CCH12-A3]|uniref:TetR/AcrR family transcriptional regulator n=1 Tax=Novosphingobium sp. CCH12-A3 TaxID=1768752 RepID=UPI0007851E68|nr:TetR/AcrR family transcriptional regulator [Novosphingobium sp. CCH12-A3]